MTKMHTHFAFSHPGDTGINVSVSRLRIPGTWMAEVQPPELSAINMVVQVPGCGILLLQPGSPQTSVSAVSWVSPRSLHLLLLGLSVVPNSGCNLQGPPPDVPLPEAPQGAGPSAPPRHSDGAPIVEASLLWPLTGKPLSNTLIFQVRELIYSDKLKFTHPRGQCHSTELPRGRATCAADSSLRRTLCLVLRICCCCLEIPNAFWTRGPMFSFCTGP